MREIAVKRTTPTRNRYYDAYRNFQSYYSHTSSAYKVDNQPYEHEHYPYENYPPYREPYQEPYRDQRNAPKTKPRTKTKPSTKTKSKTNKKAKQKTKQKIKSAPQKRFRIRIDARIRIPRGAYAIIIFIFLGMAGMVYTQAATQGARMRLFSLRAELIETRAHSAALYTELYENFNKEEIEHYATTRLNMQRRRPHQEVRVSVPRASHIVINRPRANEVQQAGVLDSITNFFSR